MFGSEGQPFRVKKQKGKTSVQLLVEESVMVVNLPGTKCRCKEVVKEVKENAGGYGFREWESRYI